MDEYVFDEAFLQARVDDLSGINVPQAQSRTVAEILQLVRDGQSGEEMGRWDAQVYSEALELLGGSLMYREHIGDLLNALDVFLT